MRSILGSGRVRRSGARDFTHLYPEGTPRRWHCRAGHARRPDDGKQPQSALTVLRTRGYITDRSVINAPMPSLSPAPATRQRRKEARPQELLDAALELFAQKGFAATRSEEVAARAGVSKGTLYLYYPSKEELLKAVIRQRLSTAIAAGAEEAEQFKGPASELLALVLTRWWLEVFDSPTSAVFKLVITEVRNFPDLAKFYVDEVVDPGQQLIGRILERGIRSGEFRAVDVPSAVLSLVLPMVMLCIHKHSLGACAGMQEFVEPHTFIHQHVQIVLHGLRAAAPPRAKAHA
jgi:AcrR family transcriptional regulator